jgi:hypothetical protein
VSAVERRGASAVPCSLNSSELTTLLKLSKRLGKGRRSRVFNLTPRVYEVLETTPLTHVLDVS